MNKLKLRTYFTSIFVLLFILSSNTFAQSDESSISKSGSFYSLFGIGFPVETNTSRELSMGISGISLDNSQSNGLHNPALWGTNAFSTASTGFSFSKILSKDNTAESKNTALQAGYLQVTFPIYREKLGISASMYPVTRSNYRFFSTSSLLNEQNETVDYASDAYGTGGINKFEVGFGWSINKYISIGYAPSLVFLSQNNSRELFFDDGSFTTNVIDSRITGSEFSHKFGLLASLPTIFSSKDRLSFGATAILPVEIDTDESILSTRQVNNLVREVTLDDNISGGAKLPLELNSGFTYYPSNFFNVSLEGKFQQWGDTDSNLNTSNETFELSDRYKLGLGTEYHAYRNNSDSFFSNFRYNAGVAYDSGHLKTDQENINTLWFSAGLGIISPFSNSTIDLSARYGLRGTTANDLIQERIWSFNISVNLTELMFFRPKLN